MADLCRSFILWYWKCPRTNTRIGTSLNMPLYCLPFFASVQAVKNRRFGTLYPLFCREHAIFIMLRVKFFVGQVKDIREDRFSIDLTRISKYSATNQFLRIVVEKGLLIVETICRWDIHHHKRIIWPTLRKQMDRRWSYPYHERLSDRLTWIKVNLNLHVNSQDVHSLHVLTVNFDCDPMDLNAYSS